MKNKKIIKLVSLTIFTFLINYSFVLADGASGSFITTRSKACGFDYMPEKIPSMTSGLYNGVRIIVPTLIVIMGMIDLVKAVMANDEKKMIESQKSFIRRLIAGIIIFMLMAIVQFAFRQLKTNNGTKNGFVNCLNCLLNNDEKSCEGGTSDLRKSCKDYNPMNESCQGRRDDYGNICETYQLDYSHPGCRIKK